MAHSAQHKETGTEEGVWGKYTKSTTGDGQQASRCDGVFHSNLNQTKNLPHSLLPAIGWISLVAVSGSFIVAVSFWHSGLFVFIW